MECGGRERFRWNSVAQAPSPVRVTLTYYPEQQQSSFLVAG